MFDVELHRTPDGRDVPTGITIRRRFGLEPAGPELEGTPDDPLIPAVERVSPRDIRRLPVASVLKAAVAYSTWDLRAVNRVLLPRTKTRLSYRDFEKLADAYRVFERRGEKPVPAIAERMGVPANRVHQWVRRMRYELKDKNGRPLLPPPPPRRSPTRERKR